MSGFNQYRGNLQRIRQSTAPIKITDIMVAPFEMRGNSNYLGEFGITTPNDNEAFQGDLKTRIGDYIEHLAQMANKEHEKAHLDETSPGQFQFKSGSENDIMRISTCEFSFYPKDRPLTLDEYRALLTRIREIAENCHENLHLVLASFPVEWPDKKVYNIVIHAQCGKDPILNQFAKSVPSAIDAIYPNTVNPSFIGSSYYPKILRDGVVSTSDTNTYTLQETLDYAVQHSDGTNMLRVPAEAIGALEDMRDKLLTDDYCRPSQTLLDCIQDSISDLTNNNLLAPNKIDLLKKEFKKFELNAIDESNRFRDAVNLVLPKPYIISNGITTPHYSRFSLQQIIDYIKLCENDASQKEKALEILKTTKQYIEQGMVSNTIYTVDPLLINHIDGMISKLESNNILDNSDVTTFENKIEAYKLSCQQIYYNNSLNGQKPSIIKDGISVTPTWYVAYDNIASDAEANTNPAQFGWAKKLLTAVRDNIIEYNNDNSIYEPDSQALLVKINEIITKYNTNYTTIIPQDFIDLKDCLNEYRKKTDDRYHDYVRPLLPQVSSDIGKTVNYAEENNLNSIAQLVKKNLDQPTLIRSSRNQLDYLRDFLLFSNTERDKNTKHPLLQNIELISAKLDKLILVDQLQQQHDVYKNIGAILIKSPLQEKDINDINVCMMSVRNAIDSLKRLYPLESVAIKEIEDKISSLVEAYNVDDIKTVTLQKNELDKFKEGYDALNVLLQKIPVDYAVKTSESDLLKLEVEKYSKEKLGDKIEKSIEHINQLITDNYDIQSHYSHLLRIFDYLNYIDTLSPESKKAMTAIKDKLNNKEKVDIVLIQELKNRLDAQSSIVEKMPYWHFPTQTLSQDITYDTIVNFRTQNGEGWFNGGICLDEFYGIRLRSYLNKYESESNPPMNVSELLTSNSYNIEPSHSINPKGIVSHADVTSGKTTVSSTKTHESLMGTRDLSTGKTLGVQQLSQAVTVSAKKNNSNYKTTIDDTNPQQLVLTDPIFGPKVVIRKYDSHSLKLLPISNNHSASVDTYTANFYIRRLDAILKSFDIPKDAVKQNQYLDEFSNKLNKLRNNHAATVNDFYRILEELESKVKLIPPNEEKTEKCMQQIALMRHYIDTKMISIESYIMSRSLDKIVGPLTLEQQKIVDEFKDDLKIIQSKALTFDSNGMPILPAKELAQAVFNLRNKVTVNSKLPQDATKLLAAYEQTKEYMRGQYPEIYSELIRLRFPEFAKVLDLVRPLGSGLSEKQLNAITSLKNALRDIEMQSLKFDPNGKPILETYDLEKALKEFDISINSIEGENIADLKLLSKSIQTHIDQLQNEFKSLNLGKDYYEKQLTAIEERQKQVKREINQHEGSKAQSSLDIERKWQYRNETNQTLESGIIEKFNNYLKTPELLQLHESSPPKHIVNQAIQYLDYIKNATGAKSKNPVVMTSEVVSLLFNFKKTIDTIPFPSLQKVYQEILTDLKKDHPEIYQSLLNSITRDKLVEQHKIYKGYKDQLKEAYQKMAREEKIETDLLPQANKDYKSKELECEQVKELLDKENQALSEYQENQKKSSEQLQDIREQQRLLNEETRKLQDANSELKIEGEKINTNLVLMRSLKGEIEQFTQLNKQIITLSELQQRNIKQQQQLRSSIDEIDSKLQILPHKITDLERRKKELKDTLEVDINSLEDRQKRLKLLGAITEKNKNDADILETQIKDFQKRINLYKSEISKFENNILSISSNIEELKLLKVEKLKEIELLTVEHDKFTKEVELSHLQRNLHQDKMNELSQQIFNQDKNFLQEEDTVLLDKISRVITQNEEALEKNKSKISNNINTIDQNISNAEKLDITIEKSEIDVQQKEELVRQQGLKVKEAISLNEDRNSELSDLKKSIQSLETERDKIKIELSGEKTSIKYLTDQVEKTRDHYEALDNQLEKHKEQQNELGSEIVKAQSDKKNLDDKHESYTQRRNSM